MSLSFVLISLGVGLVFTGLTILTACVVSISMAWLSTKLAIRIREYGTRSSDLLLPIGLGGLASLVLLKAITISLN